MLNEKIAGYLSRHRKWLLVLFLIITGLGAAIAPGIRFDFTPQAIFSGQDDIVERAESFKKKYGYADANILVILESLSNDSLWPILEPEALDWLEKLAQKTKKIPGVEGTRNITTLPDPRSSGATATLLSGNTGKTSTSDRAYLLERLSSAAGLLYSRDYQLALTVIQVDPRKRGVKTMSEIQRAVEQVVTDLGGAPADFHLRYSGLPVLRTNIVENLMADQQTLLPFAGALLLLWLAILFRSLSGVILPLGAVGAGLAWTTGTLVGTGQSFNIISNVLPLLLLVIGISNSVHIISRYAEEVHLHGRNRAQAAIATVAHMTVPCLLTFVTTGIGFASLVFSHTELLRDLAWQAALGMILVYISTIYFFGNTMDWFAAPPLSKREKPTLLAKLTADLGRLVLRHARRVVLVSLLIMGLALWLARDIRVNSYMIETYERDHPTIQTMELLEKKTGGFISLDMDITGPNPDTWVTPAYYKNIARLEEFATGLPGVLRVLSYRQAHQQAFYLGAIPYQGYENTAGEKLPPENETGLKLLKESRKQIMKGAGAEDYRNYFNPEANSARVQLKMRDIGTHETLKVITDLEKKLEELFPADEGFSFYLTGDAYLNARAMDGFIRDMFASLLFASLVIFTIIALVFHSPRVGLIAGLPNLTPLALTLGYMGWRGYDLNAGNVIVFTISLGIAVDDTIHFVSRFQEEFRKRDRDDAVIYSFLGTGRAIILTSILIVFGLSVLLLSEFVPTRRFAELTVFTMAGALVGDLLLLPGCLVLFWKKKPHRDVHPTT